MSTVKISEDFFRVPKLCADLSNWIEYRDRLQWALDARGILPHLLGTAAVPIPVVPIVSTVPAETTPEDGQTEAPAAAALTTEPRTLDGSALVMFFNENDFKTGQAQVKQAIASTIPTSIFNRIKGRKLASDVWNALVKHCQER